MSPYPAHKPHDRTPHNLANLSALTPARFDSSHVGPWTRWAHDLNAELMIIGQDWGDERYFVENRGLDNPTNPTNIALQELVLSIGLQLPQPPIAGAVPDPRSANCGIWLTNALLWLKTGGLSAKVRDDWFGDGAAYFLKAQIDIVQPRVIVALGQRAYGLVLSSYNLPKQRGPFLSVVEMKEPVTLSPEARGVRLVAVYHCGIRIRNTLRHFPEQRNDWVRVRRALDSAAC